MRRRTRRDPRTIELQLQGYRLATAEILYWMPDHPSVLQSFVWQQWDLPPNFPKLHQFLNYWKDNIEATMHSVQVACADMVKPATVKPVDAVFQIH